MLVSALVVIYKQYFIISVVERQSVLTLQNHNVIDVKWRHCPVAELGCVIGCVTRRTSSFSSFAVAWPRWRQQGDVRRGDCPSHATAWCRLAWFLASHWYLTPWVSRLLAWCRGHALWLFNPTQIHIIKHSDDIRPISTVKTIQYLYTGPHIAAATCPPSKLKCPSLHRAP